ncbi:cupin domain-containing protein [Mycolicibacterium smegmatis]|uniref:cupin domain-containing protein n=1 Tax=Mycolicibacterium smegmatis TaxID=1772 RepID=UPI001303D08E|nr:cupin domain-containing protein [Mycolicibacterium smegmatis]MCP2624596.1 cupin domain-containing protein [Mycolicibacterium smegmatis]
MADVDYTSAFNAQLTRFGAGGGSPLHSHPYNHAFYFLTGSGEVQIDGQTWQVKPGTFVKVPAHARHNLTNTGTDDLVFLVIYDSAEPRLSRGPAESLSGQTVSSR